ncbi:hypothetical protein [Sulfurimonas indica]|uniref:hypothetical protein n=1 Tax=Sulfurimonas TaxID=202746 RepID=UPI00126454B5|nr:hypothetical protein [Sulfurimonas indica]
MNKKQNETTAKVRKTSEHIENIQSLLGINIDQCNIPLISRLGQIIPISEDCYLSSDNYSVDATMENIGMRKRRPYRMVYIGRAGSGKTTKILQDIYNVKDTKVAAFVHDSEISKYAKRLKNVDFFSKENNINEVLKTNLYDTLIIDTHLSIPVDINLQLPKNIFWSFQSVHEIKECCDVFSIFNDILREMDEEIRESEKCIILALENKTTQG